MKLDAYREQLARQTTAARAARRAFDAEAKSQRTKSPTDASVALEVAEGIAAHPVASIALELQGADVGAFVAAAESELSKRIGDHSLASDPTSERAYRERTSERGSVPVARTMGRGCELRCGECEACEACSYELLDGAPVGCPESLRAARLEARATASDAYWSRRTESRNEGLSKSQRRRARRNGVTR